MLTSDNLKPGPDLQVSIVLVIIYLIMGVYYRRHLNYDDACTGVVNASIYELNLQELSHQQQKASVVVQVDRSAC